MALLEPDASAFCPVLNASGCAPIVLAPLSNARCVDAIYSSLLGAGLSVLTDSLPSTIVTPRFLRSDLVCSDEEDRRPEMRITASRLLAVVTSGKETQ